MYKPPGAPVKVKPFPSRASIDIPESPTKHKTLKQFFDEIKVIIHKTT